MTWWLLCLSWFHILLVNVVSCGDWSNRKVNCFLRTDIWIRWMLFWLPMLFLQVCSCNTPAIFFFCRYPMDDNENPGWWRAVTERLFFSWPINYFSWLPALNSNTYAFNRFPYDSSLMYCPCGTSNPTNPSSLNPTCSPCSKYVCRCCKYNSRNAWDQNWQWGNQSDHYSIPSTCSSCYHLRQELKSALENVSERVCSSPVHVMW